MALHSSRRRWRAGVLLATYSAVSCLGAAGTLAAQEAQAASAAVTPGQQLFSRHCAACHGDNGDGNGVAAVYLFPKPRSLRGGRFRLVSTANSVPTREDIGNVLVRGMPGSSMPSWAHLSDSDRRLLTDEVQRLISDGARERYVRTLKEQEQLTDEELQAPATQAEIKEFVVQQTTPGELTEVPAQRQADPTAVARGKELYTRQSCHSCHGLEGKGDGVQKMLDVEGLATRARDLTRGIYKGGHDFESLYRRIRYGMPGTPMPASTNLREEQISDMVDFLRSLSTEEQRKSVVLRRGQFTAKRLSRLPADGSPAAWQGIPAVSIQTFPLWWRDNADVHLQIQVVHDGRSLAARLSWDDATQNTRAVHSDEFEDMAALQFYAGTDEPFLGMGAGATQIDLWHWRAGSASEAAKESLLDEYPFDTPVYQELAKGKALPDFSTGRVAGNPLSVRDKTASNLVAKGFGSTTFRPQASQLVTALSNWNNGQWTTVLQRPFDTQDRKSLVLQTGQRYSLAVAVWDGESHERGGQKQISIWNDLRLE